MFYARPASPDSHCQRADTIHAIRQWQRHCLEALQGRVRTNAAEVWAIRLRFFSLMLRMNEERKHLLAVNGLRAVRARRRVAAAMHEWRRGSIELLGVHVHDDAAEKRRCTLALQTSLRQWVQLTRAHALTSNSVTSGFHRAAALRRACREWRHEATRSWRMIDLQRWPLPQRFFAWQRWQRRRPALERERQREPQRVQMRRAFKRLRRRSAPVGLARIALKSYGRLVATHLFASIVRDTRYRRQWLFATQEAPIKFSLGRGLRALILWSAYSLHRALEEGRSLEMCAAVRVHGLVYSMRHALRLMSDHALNKHRHQGIKALAKESAPRLAIFYAWGRWLGLCREKAEARDQLCVAIRAAQRGSLRRSFRRLVPLLMALAARQRDRDAAALHLLAPALHYLAGALRGADGNAQQDSCMLAVEVATRVAQRPQRARGG